MHRVVLMTDGGRKRRSGRRGLGQQTPVTRHHKPVTVCGVVVEFDSMSVLRLGRTAPARRTRLAHNATDAGQLAQLREHTLHAAARGGVTSVKVPRVRAGRSRSTRTHVLKVSRQTANRPVVGDHHSPRSHRAPPPSQYAWLPPTRCTHRTPPACLPSQ
jgi:hypothetical protein